MPTIKREEKIKITYDGSKISIKGKTVRAELEISQMELLSITSSGEGSGKLKISLQPLDEEPKTPALVAPVPIAAEPKKEEPVMEEKKPEIIEEEEIVHAPATAEPNAAPTATATEPTVIEPAAEPKEEVVEEEIESSPGIVPKDLIEEDNEEENTSDQEEEDAFFNNEPERKNSDFEEKLPSGSANDSKFTG